MWELPAWSPCTAHMVSLAAPHSVTGLTDRAEGETSGVQ